MLIPFIIAALALSIEDIMELKKKSTKKDILVYIGFIMIAVALGFWFTFSGENHSIADMLLGLFNIQG